MMVKLIQVICKYCNEPFNADAREVNRGNAKFCCKRHFHMWQRSLPKKELIPNVVCAGCGTKFYKNHSKQGKSKSGLFFCTRKCKDISQRIGGLKEIQPKHYKEGVAAYRDIARRNTSHVCTICGYNEIPQILEVHHKDNNRQNNDKSNLEFLCPTCHATHHFMTKTGKWRIRNGD
jgi:hypothetical protein